MTKMNCVHLVLLVLCISCTTNKKKAGEQVEKNDRFYVVDLDIAEYALLNLSSVFNKVETIILETSKESLVGSGFRFFAFEDYLYVLDKDHSKNFLMFDRKGKFIRKIGQLGAGPGEYTRVFDFTIDPVNGIIYLICNMVINKYSLNGTYIGAIRLDQHASYIQYTSGKLYTELPGGKFLLQEIDHETGKQTAKYLETEQYNKGWNEPYYWFEGGPFKHRSVEAKTFVHLFMDTIVAIHPSGTFPYIAIKSKHLTTNTDVKATQGKTPSDRIDAIRHKNKVLCIYNYFETQKHIYFRYKQGNQIFPIFYDKLANSYQKAFFKNDLVFGDTGDRMISPNYIFSDSNGVYESMYQPYTHELFLDWIKEGKLASFVDKRDQLMKINEDSNPVIFYYSYDDDAE